MRIASLFSTSFVTIQHYNGHYNRRPGGRKHNITVLQCNITTDVKTKTDGYTVRRCDVVIQTVILKKCVACTSKHLEMNRELST